MRGESGVPTLWQGCCPGCLPVCLTYDILPGSKFTDSAFFCDREERQQLRTLGTGKGLYLAQGRNSSFGAAPGRCTPALFGADEGGQGNGQGGAPLRILPEPWGPEDLQCALRPDSEQVDAVEILMRLLKAGDHGGLAGAQPGAGVVELLVGFVGAFRIAELALQTGFVLLVIVEHA